jgi:hypothetical protein
LAKKGWVPWSAPQYLDKKLSNDQCKQHSACPNPREEFLNKFLRLQKSWRLRKSWRLGNNEFGSVGAYRVCRCKLKPTQKLAPTGVLNNSPLGVSKSWSAHPGQQGGERERTKWKIGLEEEEKKIVLGHILGDTFTSSSGRPGRQQDKRSRASIWAFDERPMP